MKELFDEFLMCFCFAGIGSIAAAALVRVMLDKCKMKNGDWRMHGRIFRSPFSILRLFVPVVCICGMVLYGGGKGEGRIDNEELRMREREASVTSHSLLSVEHLTLTNELTRIENWFRRGAWEDGHVISFGEGWSFPYGGNHWADVEIWSQGAVYPSEKAETPIVRLTTPLALEPGVTDVLHGRTTNNTYRIEWRNAHPNRDANRIADAAIELKRNGDALVTENGVTREIPYVIPFDHDGFGQDEDWIRANFTK